MAAMRAAALLSSAGALASGASVESAKSRPVMKVVRLLQDMKNQLENELSDDKAVHEQLDCWCKTNDREKTKAIELGEARENELETFLGEAAAKMKEMTVKRNDARDEADRDFDALEAARTLRMKENKEFHKNEANLIEAVKACNQALTVLKEYNPNAANLAQVRAVATKLQEAQVLSLSKKALTRVTPEQLNALRAFMQGAGATSFLQIPGYQSYGSQSGEIFGVLEQMKADFEKDLSDSQDKEKKDVADFEELRAAKEEEIATGRALVTNLDGQIADLKAKHAQAFKELEDTQAQLELDRTFLANLQKKCSESDAEFDQRVKDRVTEIAAVDDTIAILNSDTAFDNMETTVNSFLQSASTEQMTQQQKIRLTRAVAYLQRSSARLGVPSLALLATKAQLDAFTKVKEEIDKMVTELSKQQGDEIEHRDWCIKELNKNNRSTEAAYDKKESLLAKIADLEKTIAELTKETENQVNAIAEMQEQMKRASEVREAENGDYQTTISDQRMTQMILNKALARMKEVYAFLQSHDPAEVGAPHIQTSGNHTDPGNGPARFTKYSKNAGGARVVRMLEEVIADSVKMEDDAIEAEEDSQTAYENFMQDSNKAITLAQEKIMNMNKAKATAKEDLSLSKTDLAATMDNLEELHTTLGDLKASCDYILKNFDARQEAREAEIQALKEAKAILSGAK